MQKHLHVVEGRTLFFLREPRSTLQGGARVVIEFSLADSEQVTTLRGAVLARIVGEGGEAGAGIEFPEARLARRLEQDRAGLAGRTRRGVRVDTQGERERDRAPAL